MCKWLVAVLFSALATGGVVTLLRNGSLAKIFDHGAEAAVTGGDFKVDQEAAAAERALGIFPWGTSNESLLRKDLFSAPRLLGRGWLGETWEVRDLRLQKAVAVKVFIVGRKYVTRSMIDASESTRRRMEVIGSCSSGLFLKRRSAYQAGRQHICGCLESHALDQAVASDVSFVVMEFCRGRDLKALLEQQMAKPKKQWRSQVRRWMRGLLKGMLYLSSLDPPVMHRDLHLKNVVVEENEAKIIDFDWAANATEPVRRRSFPSSPPEAHVRPSKAVKYSAEEAWAYDVWAFGIIYSNLLCSTPEGDRLKEAQAAALLMRKKKVVPESTFARSCEDGGLGYGRPSDWRVIGGALALLRDRKPPATLLEMMPKPKPAA